MTVQGPASGQLTNASHMVSLLKDQIFLPSSEPSHPPGTSAHYDDYEDSDGSEQSEFEATLAKDFSEASHSQQLPVQVGLRHLDWPQAAAGRIQVVGRQEDRNLWHQAKPQPASGLRTRRRSLRPQASLRRSIPWRPNATPNLFPSRRQSPPATQCPHIR